jgi:hypothetical protein
VLNVKLRICADDEEIIRIFGDLMEKVAEHEAISDIIHYQLVPALKDDLMRTKPKSWWRFWSGG